MLGQFENFPQNIHAVALFTFTTSLQQLQLAVTHALHRLNQCECRLDKFTDFHMWKEVNVTVNFEVGIGENATFKFLNDQELALLAALVAEKNVILLDFFCILKYYISKEKRGKTPLKFDYYMLRFRFDISSAELLIFHERGPRRVHAEELIGFIVNYIEETGRGWNLSLTIESLQTTAFSES